MTKMRKTVLSRDINLVDKSAEDCPNATTVAAINEAREYQNRVKTGLVDDACIDTTSVEAMIQSTLR